MQPHEQALFTPTEAAVLTRLSVKAVNNAIDKKVVPVRQAKLALSSRWKSGEGKAVASRPLASVAWSPVTTAAKRTQQSCGVGY